MMRSNKLWLILILVETFTLFCLGIVGNQIATLFQLPTYLLLIFAALGLSLTAILSYFARNPFETEHMAYQGLSFRDIFDRLRHRKGDSKFFADKYSKRTQSILVKMGFFGAFFYGIIAAFLRIPFTNSSHPNWWFYGLGILLFLAYIPVLLLDRQGYSSDSFLSKLVLHIILLIILFFIMMMGLGLGFIALFAINWLFTH